MFEIKDKTIKTKASKVRVNDEAPREYFCEKIIVSIIMLEDK